MLRLRVMRDRQAVSAVTGILPRPCPGTLVYLHQRQEEEDVRVSMSGLHRAPRPPSRNSGSGQLCRLVLAVCALTSNIPSKLAAETVQVRITGKCDVCPITQCDIFSQFLALGTRLHCGRCCCAGARKCDLTVTQLLPRVWPFPRCGTALPPRVATLPCNHV